MVPNSVDAQDAGKGQLEISVNQGRVPNNVQMQGAGRCLVTFIPQHAGTYVIDVTFNGEQVQGEKRCNGLISHASGRFGKSLWCIGVDMHFLREKLANLNNSYS